MPTAAPSFRHVDYLWDDREAAGLDEVGRLVYRSNLLGRDQRITNTGGGNTSSKIDQTDPLTGERVSVLWVKGSGGDLRTAERSNFASLYQERLLALRGIYARQAPRGVKTEAEDRMVSLYPHCTFDLNPRASSIDTPLHAFIPAPHVDHTHPNAVIAIAAARRSRELTEAVYGDTIAWVPWQRPGFELGLALRETCEANPRLRGIVLAQHGIISWADDQKACYELSLELIERAATFIEARDRGDETFGGARCAALAPDARRRVLVGLLPWLRGQVSGSGRLVGTVQHDDAMLEFVNGADALRLAELGTSCPDHFLRTKIKPLYVAWDPASEDPGTLRARLGDGLEAYRASYRAYYETCRHPDSPPMRDPNPTVILIPGVGMIAWGRNKSESRKTAEFYRCAVEVMRGAEAIDEYVGLPAREAFDIEYWALEEAKLQRMPPEKALARHVVVIAGAGHGIGRAAAGRVAEAGAHVVCADLDQDAARATADGLAERHGVGTGVAGSGISACGPAVAVGADLTSRRDVQVLLEEAILAYGGVDDVVITAGVYPAPDESGGERDESWRLAFDVNVRGAYLLADAARGIWADQELAGSLLLTTSVNGVVPKGGSLAYDTSKAACNHLVRELAIELAPLVRVNGVAPATVVAGSTMFPRDRVIGSLERYGVEFDESETTEALRERLAGFYARRTLLQCPVRGEDQAEAILFLISDRASRTTGQILTVDGGLREAFLR